MKTRGELAYEKYRASHLVSNHDSYGMPPPWHERAPCIHAEWEIIARSDDHLIVITIGDFSGDGHDKTQDFYVRCNKARDDVREAWFIAKGAHPSVCPTNYCNRYEEASIPDNVTTELSSRGAPIPEDTSFVEAQEMLALTLWFLQLGDPELQFEVIEAPALMFCGPDAKGRYSDSIGYGCFP